MSLAPEHVYAEIGALYRYFLTWRARILAGHFATLAAFAIAFAWLQGNDARRASILIPILAAGASTVFWLLDRRIREAYRSLLEAGEALERRFGIDGSDVYARKMETRRAQPGIQTPARAVISSPAGAWPAGPAQCEGNHPIAAGLT